MDQDNFVEVQPKKVNIKLDDIKEPPFECIVTESTVEEIKKFFEKENNIPIQEITPKSNGTDFYVTFEQLDHLKHAMALYTLAPFRIILNTYWVRQDISLDRRLHAQEKGSKRVNQKTQFSVSLKTNPFFLLPEENE